MIFMATIAILFCLADEQDNTKQPMEWYRNWALSQENPYIQKRIIEECKYKFLFTNTLSGG